MSRLALWLLVSAISCGGSQVVIEHRLSEDVLASVAPNEGVADAYASHWLAETELDRWRFERSDADYELKLAKAEKRRAEIDRSIAGLRAKQGEAAFLGKLVKSAQSAMDVSKRNVRAQSLKIRWLEVRIEYLDKEIAAARANIVATEAAFELAKAKLAQQQGIKPKGFNPAAFTAQANRASQAHQSRRGAADRAKNVATRAQNAWRSASK